MYDKAEVPALCSAYAFACGTSALIHVGRRLASALSRSTGAGDVISALVTGDELVPSVSFLVYILYTIWDLGALGYVASAQAWKVALCAIVGQVILGPGAAYAGLWWWRENVLADLAQ